MEIAEQIESNLPQFHGTESWYKNFTGILYTDGIQYLAEFEFYFIDNVMLLKSKY